MRKWNVAMEMSSGDTAYPCALRERGLSDRYPHIWAYGDLTLLSQPLLSFFCSAQCPGSLILDAYDLARELRDAAVPVISGFHSPIEKECFDLLVGGSQPVIVSPARGIARMRVPSGWREHLEAGRLLILSTFAPENQTPRTALARRRNEFVAALSQECFVAHAAARSKTLDFCRQQLAAKKRILTIDRPENEPLMNLGADGLTVNQIVQRWSNPTPATEKRVSKQPQP